MQDKKDAQTIPQLTTTIPRKVVLVDFNIFVFRAIYAWRNNRAIPATYTALNMLISCLSRIGLSHEDTVIIAADGKGNWRKEIDPTYKANRKDLREASKDIDWDYQFRMFNELLKNIEISTPFYTIKLPRIEADDIIACSTRHFKDQECIILSCDADYQQLAAYPNVKIFSDRTKRYKEVKNPYKVLASKLRKEAADNLTEEITNEQEYEIREKVVSLLKLPEEVELAVKEQLTELEFGKQFDFSQFHFESLRGRYQAIFNSDKIVTYEDSLKPRKKRKRKSKNEKI